MKNVEELYKKYYNAIVMIMTMMMSSMRLKRQKLTTNSLNCSIKQIKSQN